MSRLLDHINSDYIMACYADSDNSFSLLEFSNTIKIIKKVDIYEQGKNAIKALINSVNNQVTTLKRMNPDIDINLIAKELKKLGVNQDNSYLLKGI